MAACATNTHSGDLDGRTQRPHPPPRPSGKESPAHTPGRGFCFSLARAQKTMSVRHEVNKTLITARPPISAAKHKKIPAEAGRMSIAKRLVVRSRKHRSGALPGYNMLGKSSCSMVAIAPQRYSAEAQEQKTEQQPRPSYRRVHGHTKHGSHASQVCVQILWAELWSPLL
jgi:hypothetical protein